MAANSVYTSITKETVKGARDRAYHALNELTGGNAAAAVELVSEYTELSMIFKEFEADEPKTPLSFAEMLGEQ